MERKREMLGESSAMDEETGETHERREQRASTNMVSTIALHSSIHFHRYSQ